MSAMVDTKGRRAHLRYILTLVFLSELKKSLIPVSGIVRGDSYDLSEILWEHVPEDGERMVHDGSLRAAILEQYPDLGQIDIKGLTSETFEAWMAKQVERFGEWLVFAQKPDMRRKPSAHDKLLGNLYGRIADTLHELKIGGLIPQDRCRGVFAVVHILQPTVPLLKFTVGDVPPDKIGTYWHFAEEKAVRLLAHASEGHRLSSQSRDDDLQLFAGAVLTDDGYALSFSGLPQIDDEALVLLIGFNHGIMTDARAFELAKLAGNARYESFYSTRIRRT